MGDERINPDRDLESVRPGTVRGDSSEAERATGAVTRAELKRIESPMPTTSHLSVHSDTTIAGCGNFLTARPAFDVDRGKRSPLLRCCRTDVRHT